MNKLHINWNMNSECYKLNMLNITQWLNSVYYDIYKFDSDSNNLQTFTYWQLTNLCN